MLASVLHQAEKLKDKAVQAALEKAAADYAAQTAKFAKQAGAGETIGKKKKKGGLKKKVRTILCGLHGLRVPCAALQCWHKLCLSHSCDDLTVSPNTAKAEGEAAAGAASPCPGGQPYTCARRHVGARREAGHAGTAARSRPVPGTWRPLEWHVSALCFSIVHAFFSARGCLLGISWMVDFVCQSCTITICPVNAGSRG